MYLHPDPTLLLSHIPSPEDLGAMVKIQFEEGRFLIKTADTFGERQQAFALREVRDPDRFDALGDHLLVIDQKDRRTVAAFRLNSSLQTRVFSTSREFELDRFLSAPGVKLELSRGNIERGYRTREVVALLWRGLLAYASCVNASALFGAASVPTTSGLKVALLTHYFNEARIASPEFGIEPVAERRMDGIESYLSEIREGKKDEMHEVAQGLLPPLFRVYLGTGARVSAGPAIDRELGCVDYLLVLPLPPVALGC